MYVQGALDEIKAGTNDAADVVLSQCPKPTVLRLVCTSAAVSRTATEAEQYPSLENRYGRTFKKESCQLLMRAFLLLLHLVCRSSRSSNNIPDLKNRLERTLNIKELSVIDDSIFTLVALSLYRLQTHNSQPPV